METKNWSEATIVEFLLQKLKKNNIVYKTEVYVNEKFADVVVENKDIAIEAKLNDIGKAIKQLITYKRKYEHVFLYMPIHKKSLVEKHKITLRKLGIKWFFIDETKSFVFGHYSWNKILFP